MVELLEFSGDKLVVTIQMRLKVAKSGYLLKAIIYFHKKILTVEVRLGSK